MVRRNEAGQRISGFIRQFLPKKPLFIYLCIIWNPNFPDRLRFQTNLKAHTCSKQRPGPFCLELLGLGRKNGNAYALAALVSLAPLCISELLLKINCKIGYGFAWPTFGRPALIIQNFAKLYLLFDHQDVCLYQKLYTLYHNYFVVTVYKTLHVYYQKLRRRKWVCTSHAWMHVV